MFFSKKQCSTSTGLAGVLWVIVLRPLSPFEAGLPLLRAGTSGRESMAATFPIHGHSPFACNAQSLEGFNMVAGFTSTRPSESRQWPGLTPKRRRKLVLKRPR